MKYNMENFKLELQKLLDKYPEIMDVTFTVNQKITVNRNKQLVKDIIPDFNKKDEAQFLDTQAKAKLDTVKQMTKYD